jgi:cardiolipin synthase C
MTSLILVLLFITLIVAALYRWTIGHGPQRSKSFPSEVLPVQTAQSKLDRWIVPLISKSPRASGLILLADNVKAFAARYETAICAERSLDLQYYYWKNDLTGKVLCHAIIQAAQRGVRIRLLLDDVNSYGIDPTYIALDSHPNIEVRLFNPVGSRNHVIQRAIELVLRYSSTSRRMHNKSWIADGRVAIVGGRNIGDAYFDASEIVSFRDVDALVIGRAVSDAQVIFDRYWNSESSLSIRALHKLRNPKFRRLSHRLDVFFNSRKTKDFLNVVKEHGDYETIFQLSGSFHWTDDARIVADPPEKAVGGKKDDWLGQKIVKLLQSAQSEVEIVSPYFIPGVSGVEELRSIVARGVRVSVLTNSLAATDVIAVHGAYARYRKSIIESGVHLFELKQKGVRRRSSLFGSSSASLHTKSFVIDSSEGFIGSFNLDPRSKSINTEMGVFFRHPQLAQELKDIFEIQTSSKLSYQIQLRNDLICWFDKSNAAYGGQTLEPEASLGRRLTARILRIFPIESQL